MPLIVSVGPGESLEVGQDTRLTGSTWGGRDPVSIAWTPTKGLSDPTSATTDASPVTTTDYVFTATDAAGCSASAAVTITVTGETAAPTFDPAPGEVDEGTMVNIACATPDAEIRYTTDGSEVLETSALYASLIALTSDTTIRARAFKVDFTPSPEVSGAYVVIPAPPVPDEGPELDDLGSVTGPEEDDAEPAEEDVVEPEEDVVEAGEDVTESAGGDVAEPGEDIVEPAEEDIGEPDDASSVELDAVDAPADAVPSANDATASPNADTLGQLDASTDVDIDEQGDIAAPGLGDVLPTPVVTSSDGGCSSSRPMTSSAGMVWLLLAAIVALARRPWSRKVQVFGTSAQK